MQLADLLAPYGVAAAVAPGALRAAGTADLALRVRLAPYAVTRVPGPAEPAEATRLSDRLARPPALVA